MQFILAVLALLLIAKALLQISREKIPTPDAFTSVVWGGVLLLGAIEFLRYSDLTLKGVLVLMLFVILLTVLFLLLPKVTPRRPPSLPPVTHQMLQLTRFVSVLVIIGVGLRLYHNVVIYQRPLFDVQLSYEITATEIMPGTWFSRFAVVLFLWPLPASILAWYAIQLRWWDRALFFIGSLGHAFFGLMQGGRSGLLLTLAFLLPIVWLSLVVGPASYASKRQKSLFLTGVVGFAGASVLLLLVMFGLRTSDSISGGKFSRVMDVNPRYEQLVDPFKSSVLQEGILGAVGYGTQPSQRLSLFFEMGLEDERFYGAWNFDVFANILRRVGIGVEHYSETLSKVYSSYYEQGIPTGTFSTCIRDFYLDFGWGGVAGGAILMVTLSQFFFRRVVYFHRVDRLPYLGFCYAMLGISPLFSGLQVGSANLSLCGVIAGAFLMRIVGKPSPVAVAPLAPGLQWRQGKKARPTDE